MQSCFNIFYERFSDDLSKDIECYLIGIYFVYQNCNNNKIYIVF